MKAVESEGTTVDQAVERALILLDLPRERVEVEVLQEPGAGNTAVVRVTPVGQSARKVSRETPAPAAPMSSEAKPEAVGSGEASDIKLLVVELLGKMGLSCRVGDPVLEEDGQRTRIELQGDDAAVVIGRQGQTLDAIELVINRIADRRWPGSPLITIDAEGYRDRRARKLVEIALEEAAEVRRSGCAVELEPMSPRDRRSVHMALQEEQGVTTHSEGEGAYRHIVIEPAGPLGIGTSRSRIR